MVAAQCDKHEVISVSNSGDAIPILRCNAEGGAETVIKLHTVKPQSVRHEGKGS
jgi:hypothetical protein